MKTLQARFVVFLFLLATSCGQIVSSKKSTLKYSPTGPIEVGDAIFYYLPRGVIKVDGTYDNKGLTVTITPDIHADGNHRDELALNQRYPFFDHNAILTTDDKTGLLKTVYGSSTDRTVDAIGALITAAGQLLQFAASVGGGGALEPALGAEATPTPTPPFGVMLDPFDPNQRSKTRGDVTISVNAPPRMELVTKEREVLDSNGRYAGIMTRLTIPFTVTVQTG